MARVEKFRCDHCGKEVEDPYLENGWLKFDGAISRSWGIRRRGRDGDAQTDYIGKSSEFCSVKCLVAALDKIREEKRGPKILDLPDELPNVVPDPFKEPPPKRPWEDPLPEEDVSDAVRAYESSIADAKADDSPPDSTETFDPLDS